MFLDALSWIDSFFTIISENIEDSSILDVRKLAFTFSTRKYQSAKLIKILVSCFLGIEI
jgi:hypothetical protein